VYTDFVNQGIPKGTEGWSKAIVSGPRLGRETLIADDAFRLGSQEAWITGNIINCWQELEQDSRPVQNKEWYNMNTYFYEKVVDAVRQHDAVPRWDNLNKWFKV
jgi:hypothetical protein